MSRRVSAPSSEVPCLTDKAIEDEATLLLLREFEEDRKTLLDRNRLRAFHREFQVDGLRAHVAEVEPRSEGSIPQPRHEADRPGQSLAASGPCGSSFPETGSP